ncbi:MAG TPA: T9SS type A sorting domain-containing protein, partial [Chitinophagaceae bacterium]|nr:T9SS type A sorting domain-containing protein [Chitinophagaceae bacterium]
ELRVTIPSHWQGKKISYEVFSTSGQKLFQQVSNLASQTETIDMSRLAAGSYIVKVTCGNETAHQKLIRR